MLVKVVSSYSWQLGEHPRLTQNETAVECCSEKFVPIVAITQLIGTSAQEEDTQHMREGS